MGCNNIVEIVNLPNNKYTIVPQNTKAGFYWDYLLYIPDVIKNNYLLVIPNNTGGAYGDIDINKDKAKDTIIWKSPLADKLGVPLLVPVFPRPKAQEPLYTHALNRTALLTQSIGVKRLDLQLIAMTEDARKLLKEKKIIVDDQILMSGFSASGDFADRFSYLHPEMVKAVVLGGCDNMLPLSSYNGENLPYPAGTYDYEAITNKQFDQELFARIERYIYKGSEDEGGWYTIEKDGKSITYTGKDYFEKYEMPDFVERQNLVASPLYKEGELSEETIKELLFRCFEGKCYVDRFHQTKLIFQKLGLNNNKFVEYEAIGHKITDRIKKDELNFFLNLLEK